MLTLMCARPPLSALLSFMVCRQCALVWLSSAGCIDTAGSSATQLLDNKRHRAQKTRAVCFNWGRTHWNWDLLMAVGIDSRPRHILLMRHNESRECNCSFCLLQISVLTWLRPSSCWTLCVKCLAIRILWLFPMPWRPSPRYRTRQALISLSSTLVGRLCTQQTGVLFSKCAMTSPLLSNSTRDRAALCVSSQPIGGFFGVCICVSFALAISLSSVVAAAEDESSVTKLLTALNECTE